MGTTMPLRNRVFPPIKISLPALGDGLCYDGLCYDGLCYDGSEASSLSNQNIHA